MNNAYEYNQIYFNKDKSQKEMLIEYLYLYGSITPLEAMIAFGCYRLGARIWDLRHEGYSIETDKGDNANYAVYRIA